MHQTTTTNTTRPARPEAGWDPERGVFILPEASSFRAVTPGVALQAPNGQRPPPRRTFVICDPARRPPRSRRRLGGWLLLLAAVATVAACAVGGHLLPHWARP